MPFRIGPFEVGIVLSLGIILFFLMKALCVSILVIFLVTKNKKGK